MEQKFINKNYEIVPFEKNADVYIVNTCTVTSISDKKSRQFLRKAKQQNNNAFGKATAPTQQAPTSPNAGYNPFAPKN